MNRGGGEMDQENKNVRPKITEEERKRRQEATDYAIASLELSGFKFSKEDIERSKRFINGEIELQEEIDEITAEAKKLVDEHLKNGGTMERPSEYLTEIPDNLPPQDLTPVIIDDY